MGLTAQDIGFAGPAKPERFERLGEGHYGLSAPDPLNTESR
jgi:hypothetical protein